MAVGSTNADVAAVIRDIDARLAAQRERTVPKLRQLRRTLSRELRLIDGAKVLRIGQALLAPNSNCPRWFTYEIVHHHSGAMAQLSAASLDRLGKGLSAWYEVDPFACYLLGVAWRDGRISDACIHRWAKSKDRWRRRSALVSTVALNNTARGGSGDSRRTLAVCDRLLLDRDDMVVKAMSWALRALAVKQPLSVECYLVANQDSLAARVRREVSNKLTFGLKSGKRRSDGLSLT